MATAIMRQAILLLCLGFGHRQGAACKSQQARVNDIIVASTPVAPSKASDGSDIMVIRSPREFIRMAWHRESFAHVSTRTSSYDADKDIALVSK